MEVMCFGRTYSQYSEKLTEGEPLFFRGRVSVREEDDTKLVLDKVYTIEERASAPPASLPKGRAPRPRVEPGTPRPALQRQGGRLLIRVQKAEGEQWEKLRLLFSIFEGEIPLLVREAETGRLLRAGAEFRTDANPVLLRELRQLLGEENVALLPPEAAKP